MVDDRCTSIPYFFPLNLVHMLLSGLVLSILLIHKFMLRFSHGLAFGSLLIFQIVLYMYHHSANASFFLLFLSWYNIGPILKVITSSPLLLTNQRHFFQRLYGIWCQSSCNQCHQQTSPGVSYLG